MDVYRDGDAVVRGGERAGDAKDLESGGEIGGHLCTGGKPITNRFSIMPCHVTLVDAVSRAWCVCDKKILRRGVSCSSSPVLRG